MVLKLSAFNTHFLSMVALILLKDDHNENEIFDCCQERMI